MTEFIIHKGVGKSVEFQGLTLKYILMLAGGFVGLLLLFALLSIVGLRGAFNLSITLVLATIYTWRVFTLSKKYGEYGVMKREARRYRPRYIIHRKSISKLFQNAKYI